MPNCKLLFQRGQMEPWQSWYGLYDRPAFIVVSPDGEDFFPSFDNPNNGDQAVSRVKELREKYGE